MFAGLQAERIGVCGGAFCAACGVHVVCWTGMFLRLVQHLATSVPYPRSPKTAQGNGEDVAWSRWLID